MEVFILAVFAVWLVIISFTIYSQFKFLRNLIKGSKEEDLVKVLKKVLDTQTTNSRSIDLLKKELTMVRMEGMGHIQKMGLVRFNPFRETGGDHSFSLAVLDGKNNGFVITGLHTRERTRLYLKGLSQGVSESELSNEEKKALVAAEKN